MLRAGTAYRGSVGPLDLVTLAATITLKIGRNLSVALAFHTLHSWRTIIPTIHGAIWRTSSHGTVRQQGRVCHSRRVEGGLRQVAGRRRHGRISDAGSACDRVEL